MKTLVNDNKSNNINKNRAFSLIDCDVHPFMSSLDELVPYLDEANQKRLNIGKFKNDRLKNQNNGGFTFPLGRYGNPGHVLRTDAISPNDATPGSDTQFLTKDLFDLL
ncbi:hypothetical protein [Bacillus salipaludis]|uniref:Amidohydrolase n=1 Tax=Bacillus salipaludis TaxID=2547811 RepID=A0ABW8RNI0_9BACI